MDKQYLITILQKDNQTIVAYELDENSNYTGVSYTKSFFANPNSKWKFTVIPDKNKEDYTLHIVQSEHQSISVDTNNDFHDYRSGILVSYPTDDSYSLIKSSYPELGYTTEDKYQYLIVNQNCRVFATLAKDVYDTSKYHTITIKQVPHQTIIVTYRNKNYYYTNNIIVENNEEYSVKLLTDDGYSSSDSLYINNQSVGRTFTSKATEDIIISAPAPSREGVSYLEFKFSKFIPTIEDYNNHYVKTTTSTSTDDDGKESTTTTITHGKIILGEGTDSLMDTTTIYQYSKDTINNTGSTPLEFYENENEENADELYTSSLFNSNNILYLGSTNNPSITSNKFIQSSVSKYYNYKNFFGYFKELNGCKAIRNTITSPNSNLTVQLFGFTTYYPSKKATKQFGKWIIGFDENTEVTINNIIIYILDDNNQEVLTLSGFKFANTFHKSDSGNLSIYQYRSPQNELDKTYLYLLNRYAANKNAKLYIKIT